MIKSLPVHSEYLSVPQVSVEVSVQHPFYVCGKGWCSLAPGRTSQRYRGLGCKLLQVDDVCLSLTQRDAAYDRDSKRKASPYSHVSPPPPPATPRRTTPRPNSSSSANSPSDQANNSKHINRHLGKNDYKKLYFLFFMAYAHIYSNVQI